MNDLRVCQECGKVCIRHDMLWTHHYCGCEYKLVCHNCWETIMARTTKWDMRMTDKEDFDDEVVNDYDIQMGYAND